MSNLVSGSLEGLTPQEQRLHPAYVGEAECYYAGAIAAMSGRAQYLAMLQAEDPQAFGRYLETLKYQLPPYAHPLSEPGTLGRVTHYVLVEHKDVDRMVPREISFDGEAIAAAEQQILSTLSAQLDVRLNRREQRLPFASQLEVIANRVYARGLRRVMASQGLSGVGGIFAAMRTDIHLIQYNAKRFVDNGRLSGSTALVEAWNKGA